MRKLVVTACLSLAVAGLFTQLSSAAFTGSLAVPSSGITTSCPADMPPAVKPMATPPSTLAQVGTDSFALDAPAAGTFTARVHFTPYWQLADGHGCVSRAPGDWTRVQTRGRGRVRVVIGFSLARVLSDSPRCR